MITSIPTLPDAPEKYSQQWQSNVIGTLNRILRTLVNLTAAISPESSRYVSVASDTCSANDHTVIMFGVSTEYLPASPGKTQEMYLVNIGSAAVTLNGNGNNIWSSGTVSSSLSLPTNTARLIKWDSVSPVNIWRVIS